VVALGCFVFAWFATGPRSHAAPPADAQT
jgi:hypothetical protein